MPVKDSLYGKTISSVTSNGRGGVLNTELTKSYSNGCYSAVQGSFKRFGDFEASDYILSNTGLIEKNLSFRFGINRFDYAVEGYYSFHDKSIGILRSSHSHSASSQIRAINSNEPLIIRDFTYDIEYPKQDVKHHIAELKHTKSLTT